MGHADRLGGDFDASSGSGQEAMDYRMPMAVWRAGMAAIEAAGRSVDMPLRLDNADALPTCPQQEQKQQVAV